MKGLITVIYNTKNYLRLYQFFKTFIIIANCIEFIFIHGYDLYLLRNDYHAALELFFYMTLNLTAMTKTATFFFQEEKYDQLKKDITDMKGNLKNEDDYVERLLKIGDLISNLFTDILPTLGLVLMIMLMIILAIPSIANRTLNFIGWYPCDTALSPCFEVVVLVRSTMGVINLFSIGFSDLLFMGMLVKVLVQFKILRHNILHIKADAKKKVNEAGNSLETQDQPEVVIFSEQFSEQSETFNSDSEVTESVQVSQTSLKTPEEECSTDSIDSNTPIIKLIAKKLKERHRAARIKLSIETEMNVELVKCVRHHQHLLSLIGDVESFFSPFLFIQLLSNLIGSVSLATFYLLAPAVNLKLFLQAGLFSVCVVELFLITKLCSMITEESEEVRNAVYGCDWVDSSESFKRSMRIIMSRSNNSVVLTGAWVVPMSMESFVNVMNNVYSYMMVMLTMAEK